MRIDGSGRVQPGASRTSRKEGAGDGVFKPDMGSAATRASQVPMAANATGIDAILALQGVDDALASRRKAIRRGRSMLDILDEVKADLLAGQVGESRLNSLLALVQQAKERVDPQLDALVEDIELRARVELAKLGRFVAQ